MQHPKSLKDKTQTFVPRAFDTQILGDLGGKSYHLLRMDKDWDN
jgi:hypothetical protein